MVKIGLYIISKHEKIKSLFSIKYYRGIYASQAEYFIAYQSNFQKNNGTQNQDKMMQYLNKYSQITESPTIQLLTQMTHPLQHLKN